MPPAAMSGGEPVLMSQCLEVCQALASMGQTISFSLKLGSTFSFNLDTRSKATNFNEIVKKKNKPSPSTVKRNKKRMEKFIEKKKTSSLETIPQVVSVKSTDLPTVDATGDSLVVPAVKTVDRDIPGNLPDVPLVLKDNLLEKTKCEECGFISKSSRGLKVHESTQHRISQVDGANDQEDTKSKQTQTDDACPFCKDLIESKEVHNVSRFCPKNKVAQTIALYQIYGYQNIGHSQGFPANQF